MTITVTELWRFPVKSMGGDRVDEVRVDERGLHADRLWAVRDLDNNITATARRLPALLGCTARYEKDPGEDAGPGNVPPVVITFPDGSELSSSDAAVHDRLSELIGRRLRLTALPPRDDTSLHRMSARQGIQFITKLKADLGVAKDDPMPDTSVFTTQQIMTLARFSTPPGMFVDLAPVHLLSTTSLRSLSADGEGYDVRRFRPNVLVAVDEPTSEYPETDWVGGDLTIGGAALRVTIPTVRCVVPTRPQPGVELDRQVGRQLNERTGRFLGVYVDVTRTGLIKVGDEVQVGPAATPSAVKKTVTAVSRGASRGLQRVLEKTVLRSS